ncbi:MAG: cyclic nucleotide-binding domain-containing protein [Cyanobacteriota bacterium]
MKWKALLLAAITLELVGRLLPESWGNGEAASWLTTGARVLSIWVVVRLASWLLLEWPATRRWWQAPPKILRDLGQTLVATLLSLTILQQQANVNLVGLVTTSAVLAAVVGLAAQETLKDLFAGISLQLDPPFHQGDWVAVGETAGVVDSLTLMNTRLRNLEGARIAIPNATVVQTALRSYRSTDPVALRFSIGLDYAMPPQQAIQLVLGVLEGQPGVLKTPPSEVWVKSYGDSAVVYEVLLWHLDAGEGMRSRLRSGVLTQLWYALGRNGWSIPFPVRQVEPRRHRTDSTHPSRLTLDQRMGLLQGNPLFAQLEAQQIQALAKRCQVLRFAPGEVILRQGNRGDQLYQVISGRLEVWRQDGELPPQHLAVLGVGEVVGEMGLFTDAPRSATVRAQGECLVLEVERRDLAPLFEREPELVDQLAALIAKRRAELTAQQQGHTSEPATAGLAQRIRQLFGLLRPG